MNNLNINKLIVAVSFILATSTAAFAQEYKTIRTMGLSNPVCDGGIDNPAELQKYVKENRSDFLNMVNNSGWPGSTDELISAISKGEFSEVLLPAGTQFQWMGVRRRTTGKADSVTNLEWGGDEPVDAYAIKTEADGKEYMFVIPKICCNLAMLTTVSAENVDKSMGAAIADSLSSPLLIPFIAPFIGYEDRNREECPEGPGAHGNTVENSAPIAGAIFGVLKPISDRTAILAQLGGAYNFDESKYSTAFADLGLNFKVGENGFVGGGVGVWDINDSDNRDGSFFIQAGVDAFEVGQSTAQWFIEGRALFDEPSDNKIVLTGLRFLFDK